MKKFIILFYYFMCIYVYIFFRKGYDKILLLAIEKKKEIK